MKLVRTYLVWYKKQWGGRATEYVLLDQDYDYAGTVEGISPRDAASAIYFMDPLTSDLENHRKLQIGDVLQEVAGDYYILTSDNNKNSYWAKVIPVGTGEE